MKKLFLLSLFSATTALAGPFGIGDPVYIAPPPITPAITILPPLPQYPLSFCGQYPNANACKSKPEPNRTKCIDGLLYHEVISHGDHYWVQSHDEDGTAISCHNYKE